MTLIKLYLLLTVLISSGCLGEDLDSSSRLEFDIGFKQIFDGEYLEKVLIKEIGTGYSRHLFGVNAKQVLAATEHSAEITSSFGEGNYDELYLIGKGSTAFYAEFRDGVFVGAQQVYPGLVSFEKLVLECMAKFNDDFIIINPKKKSILISGKIKLVCADDQSIRFSRPEELDGGNRKEPVGETGWGE